MQFIGLDEEPQKWRISYNAYDNTFGNTYDNAYQNTLGNAYQNVLGNAYQNALGNAYDNTFGNAYTRWMVMHKVMHMAIHINFL